MPDVQALLLRLEGPLQAWGGGSKWVVRETDDTPTLSGVVGILCATMGLGRDAPLDEFAGVQMAVRVDREGAIMRDYHTVGAKIGCMRADRKGIKHTASTGEIETVLSDRYYLADASFLAALAAPAKRVQKWAEALQDPVWPPYLGRKSCPPSVPVFEDVADMPRRNGKALSAVLKSRPWRPRLEGERVPDRLRFQLPAGPTESGASPRTDVPRSFRYRTFDVRHVKDVYVSSGEVERREPLYEHVKGASGYVNYRSSKWLDKSRKAREEAGWLCRFCGLPAEHAHHMTYERAGDESVAEDLCALCHTCHDAVTMLEAEHGMRIFRIDPLSEAYRDLVLDARERLLKERFKRDFRRERLSDVLRVIAGD